MMIQQAVGEQPDVRNLAVALLEQGERCAVAGLLNQAEAVLTQVWAMIQKEAPDLASDTAWHLAWLLAQRGAYAEAADWFHRMDAPPARISVRWPTVLQTIAQMCLALAREPTQIPQALPSPHVPALSSGLPTLHVINLGQFQLIRAGTILPACKAHKAISLLRYLLTQRPRMVHKEVLMDLFWPESPPRDARNSLHAAICALRHHIDLTGASYVLFEDDHYMVDPHAPVEDDVTAFEHLSNAAGHYWQVGDMVRAQQSYSQAILRYQGDYYVDSRDLAWAAAVQEHLLTQYLSALDHLGQILMGQRHYERAAECYQRLLARDGYREDAHCQLMRCYWQLGRRQDALRQYEQCTALLANDLGMEPMAETQALCHAIRNHTGTAALPNGL